ncbi:MAG: trigger factor [Arenicellales bacterium]|nr:trigger factor [Arenicellales bacterium]
MQVSVENLGTISRRLTVAVPAEQVEKEVAERLKRLAKSARLPGFRPGKAPLKVIESRFGGDVLNEVASSLIESSLREALTQENLIPAGGPEVQPTKLERGEDLEYVASFDIFPKIDKLDISGVEMERPVYNVDDTDIDATIETMRKQRVTWQAVDRPAQDKDQVVINFVGHVDGEEFAGNKAENLPVVLGEKTLLDEFEEGLRGCNEGDQISLDVKFPDDYRGKDVAGKLAKFDITVRAVNEPVLPEVDAEFAKSFGIEDGDLQKMREEVANNVKQEMEERIRRVVRERVLNALIEVNDIELPTKLVEAEIDHMIESNKAILEGQGIAVRNVVPDRSRFQQDAEKRVALGLIMQAIVSEHDLKPDAERVRQRVELQSTSYEDPKAFVQWYYSDRQRLAQLESMILEEQVIEKVLETADAKDKEMSFQELMEYQSS